MTETTSDTAADRDLAYEAGKAAFSDPRPLGPEACPFDPHTDPEQRLAWLEGLSDALEAAPSPDDLAKAIDAAKADA
jgi:hypothetical protein